MIAFYSKTIAETKLNYPIYNKKILVIVSGFLNWRVELEDTTDQIKIVSNYKALEYFITTKALIAQQACWAEVLLYYYF